MRICQVCGATDYPDSMGGENICPSCDCGNTIRIGKNLYKRVGSIDKYDLPKNGEQPCLWDSMPETSPGSGTKIGLLSCPCPKCSPRC